MSGETDKGGRSRSQRRLSLGEAVEATLAHYTTGPALPTDTSLRRRRVAFVREVARVLPMIAQRTGVSPEDITLFSSAHEDRRGTLPPVPLSRPRLFQDIPQQQRRRLPTTEQPSDEPDTVGQPQAITFEMLQAMSPEDRANTIITIRRNAGISQGKFAKTNHIALMTLIKIETMQDLDPSEGILEDICNGLTQAQAVIAAREERFLESLATMSSQEILLALIKRMRISYQEFGDKIGKSKSWVDKTIAQKTRRLTLGTIIDICNGLGLKDDDPIKIRLLEQIYAEEHVRQLSRRTIND